MAELPLRDLIVKRLAVKMRINESDVDAVITHQFKGVVKALKECDTVEIAGFGKFVFSQTKAKNMVNSMKRHLENHLTGKKLMPSHRTVESAMEEIEGIEKRIHGNKTKADTGGGDQSGIQDSGN